ncbi:hypothetical protein J2776_004524 [Paraburkholderia caledonica]|uniref:Uncharacterized protein n=1 Tax=Paraburkholderia caledonica TaxID=134536 RepID=A0ABU1L3K4_9BURK|nr:hypothetical protein [Paraburkholderia caledonica]
MVDSIARRGCSPLIALRKMPARVVLTELNHFCLICRSFLPRWKIALSGHGCAVQPKFRDLT